MAEEKINKEITKENEIKIHNNKCIICGKEVKGINDIISHYDCFNKKQLNNK